MSESDPSISQSKPHLAVFDIDGTLLKGDCLLIAAKHENEPIGLLLKCLKFLPVAVRGPLRLISTSSLKEEFIGLFFGSPLCKDFPSPRTQAAILQNLRPEAIQRLRWHKDLGHRVILCSASPNALLQPLAEALGVELICSEQQRANGHWLPKLAGPNCKGQEKIRRLQCLVGPLSAVTLEAYGDSKGDRELLLASSIPHFRDFKPHQKPYPRFNVLKLIPILALAILVYGLIGLYSQGGTLLPILKQLAPAIETGTSLVLIGYAIRFLRWRLLMRTLGLDLPPLADLRIWMGSYAFTATPGKSGEAVRCILLKDEFNVPAPKSLAGLITERITDGVAVLALAFLNLPAIIQWRLQLLPAVIVFLVTASAIFAISKVEFLRQFLCQRALRIIPASFRLGSTDTARFMWQLMKPKVFALATVLGTASWALEGTSLAILIHGMGISPPPFSLSIISHTISGLLGAISMLPGGLGSTEASTVGILAFHGISLNIATTATLLIRLMTLWLATLLGIICLLIPATKHTDIGSSGSTLRQGER